MSQRKQALQMDCDMEPSGNSGNPTSENRLLQWTQWQLLDSILPTGGFAHSYGLEAAVQARFVSEPDDLKAHVIYVLENTGSLLLPFVYTANRFPDIETWSKLNKTMEATLMNEVSRKASISQGSALLRVAASVFTEAPLIKEMRESLLSSGAVSFHHAPVFGLISGLLGFDSGTCQRAYMFMTMRDVISAATRLNLVGPLGASVLQHQIAHAAEGMVEKWMDRPIEDACQTAPLLDVVQGCHGYLFSRLFCS
ncbi:urease accessory protein F isoform X2 [Magnolia sinica]|nr:urease accessory protein F isoform X2 [Magnolia sinica]